MGSWAAFRCQLACVRHLMPWACKGLPGSRAQELCSVRPCLSSDAAFRLPPGTSVGQDLNLSLERVTASRNFTNKLWNAGKFVLFNLDKVRPCQKEGK